MPPFLDARGIYAILGNPLIPAERRVVPIEIASEIALPPTLGPDQQPWALTNNLPCDLCNGPFLITMHVDINVKDGI